MLPVPPDADSQVQTPITSNIDNSAISRDSLRPDNVNIVAPAKAPTPHSSLTRY